jgi:hypothetical protein
MRFINLTRWTCSSVRRSNESSKPIEVKTRFATVDDAAFKKLLYEKDAKKHQKRHRVGTMDIQHKLII